MIKSHRLLIVISLLAALCLTAAAQSYSIRVTHNTNIRAEPSLNGRRLETVPAGTVLEVIEQFNRWLRVNRGGEAWMASWVSHQRVEAPVAQPAAQPVTDNCCGVDRQCQHDQEWVNGYWAYQRGECGAPAPTGQTQAPVSQTQAPVSQPVTNNCCGIDRTCHSDQQWTDGYWDFQRGQCDANSSMYAVPGVDNCCLTGWSCQAEHEWIFGFWAFQHRRCTPAPDRPPAYSYTKQDHNHIHIIQLTDGFSTMVHAGFELLREYAPQWYNYGVNAITEYRERHCCGTGVYGASGIVVFHHAPHSVRPYIRQDDYTMAENIVHEACHVYQDREGRGVGGDNSWLNEYECELYARDAAMLMGGVSLNIGPDSRFLNDPMNRALWWWTP